MTRIARTLAVVTVIAAAGIVLTPPPAQAYSGSLDVSFGEHGMVTTDFGADDDGAASSAIQPDGKIVTGGHSGTDLGISSVYSDFALARYNFDGSLDGSFGTGGKVTTGFGGDEEAFSVAVQSDGKIALGGYASRGYFYDFAPICYHGHVSARQPDALIRERGGGYLRRRRRLRLLGQRPDGVPRSIPRRERWLQREDSERRAARLKVLDQGLRELEGVRRLLLERRPKHHDARGGGRVRDRESPPGLLGEDQTEDLREAQRLDRGDQGVFAERNAGRGYLDVGRGKG